MTNLKNLDMDYFKRIAERVKQEKDNPKVEPKKIKPITSPDVFPKGSCVYVPKLGLYLSADKFHYGRSWNEAQDTLQAQGRRMPTIPEFIEFVKYLKSNDGQLTVKNGNKILDEIYRVKLPDRGEWLDAKFEMLGARYVASHIFNSAGKIVKKLEQLEGYVGSSRGFNGYSGIDFESWLNDSNSQGLPRTIEVGSMQYLPPVNGKVAGFIIKSGRPLFTCDRNPDEFNSCIGVRYVQLNLGAKK